MLHEEKTSKEKANNNTSGNTSGSIRDDAHSMKEDGAHMAETIIEQGQDKYNELKSYSSHYIKKLEEEVAEKPVQSMALAVGAGMLLSLLMKRR